MTALATIVDIAIVITLAEALLLTAWFHVSGRGLAPRDGLPNIAAGLCLMLALRCVLLDAAVPWVVVCLTLAGAAHATDMVWRLRKKAATA